MNTINYKTAILIASIFGIALLISSCTKLDNYDPPSAKLSGHLVYKGETLGVEYNAVPYQIYQDGFGKTGPISATFAPDGSYSTLLFDGNYKLLIPNNQGPFRWRFTPTGNPDTLAIAIKGDQVLDLEVTPYYMIRTPQLTVSEGKVSGTFKLEKIITDANAKTIESVAIYINKGQFVSNNGNERIAMTSINGSAVTDLNNISLSVLIPAMVPAQNSVYARVGVKITGVEDRLYSSVQKLNF
ncbi:DUF3823 domain-containing protein [Pedobacter miscanthi]|uniref:DUF3823 domain-containing protein n=1 Tax=Pedobacter miscanthi TaxID=2259170 RepID=UPI00292DA4CC|nr:DUF3823 domain-containing protein [Pedobacter miscanthi]